jgi:hypothetical protein
MQGRTKKTSTKAITNALTNAGARVKALGGNAWRVMWEGESYYLVGTATGTTTRRRGARKAPTRVRAARRQPPAAEAPLH